MSTLKRIKRVYFDLEVSPNLGAFWRPGHKQSISYHQIIQEREILTAAWKWEGRDKVHGIEWDYNGEPERRDIKIIEKLTEVLTKADEVVTQNGKAFDEKWLRTRALMLGLPPLPAFRHVDVLQRLRRNFNFNSNKQDYVAKVLGVGAKNDMGFQDWIDMWLHLDRKAGKKMLDYNKKDVIDLELIDQKTRVHENQPINSHVLARFSGKCPNCKSKLAKNGKYRTNLYTYQRYLCTSCGTTYRQQDNRRHI